jgi:hypothetical protein
MTNTEQALWKEEQFHIGLLKYISNREKSKVKTSVQFALMIPSKKQYS